MINSGGSRRLSLRYDSWGGLVGGLVGGHTIAKLTRGNSDIVRCAHLWKICNVIASDRGKTGFDREKMATRGTVQYAIAVLVLRAK